MKVWVYVEGRSDCVGLEALWKKWKEQLKNAGWGFAFIPLDGKNKFLKKIGDLAAEKLRNDDHDLVVGLPDLYPVQPSDSGGYQHCDLESLRCVQRREVEQSLAKFVRKDSIDGLLERFYPAAFKHDAEVLLLLARDVLAKRLRSGNLGQEWRVPPEEQNLDTPPKKVIERLFMKYPKRAYRETADMNAILQKVESLKGLLFDEKGKPQCPVFQGTIDWIGQKTGVPAY